MLNRKGFGYPNLVDVEWRLDYVFKTRDIQQINTPLYTLKLKLNTGEECMFTCTIEQLQDLHQKLLDAVKQVCNFTFRKTHKKKGRKSNQQLINFFIQWIILLKFVVD